MRVSALLAAIVGSVVVSTQGARANEPIQLVVSFAKENHIAANIKNECRLVDQLRDFIVAGSGGAVAAASDGSDVKQGSVLVVEITESVSQGNAFVGHRKYTAIEAKLYDGGAVVDSFDASRNSMGGAFAGYKGSCAVLGRTVKALAQDVNRWLASPPQRAQLGDR